MCRVRVGRALLALLAVFLCALAALPAWADSQVRIVRLSDVDGSVQIDRRTGQGWEKALLNMPIVQGTQLATGADAHAEVEFENGSTVRLAPDTKVEFRDLSLRDSGGRLSTVEVQQGATYFHVGRSKNDEFRAAFGRQEINVPQPAEFRVEVGNSEAKLAVTRGQVQFQAGSQEVKVQKDETVSFNLEEQDNYTLAKGVDKRADDQWNKQEDQYRNRYGSANSYASSWPYSYGLSDLNYYGNYFYSPMYGMLWQPFYTGANWNPFMNGAWAWYPGYGYTWVSAYPWGWMPYRYGNWLFVPGGGWAWQPGSVWNTWNTMPNVINPPASFVRPQAPGAAGGGNHGTVVVNRGPRLFMPGFAPRGKRPAVASDGLRPDGLPAGRIQMGTMSRSSISGGHAIPMTRNAGAGMSAPARMGGIPTMSPATGGRAGSSMHVGGTGVSHSTGSAHSGSSVPQR